MLRIQAGGLRGRKMGKIPAEVRPLGARLKKSMFDVLRPRLSGAAFLDLFAGSGGVGLEALSRGAASCVFVEKDDRLCGRLMQLFKRWAVEARWVDHPREIHPAEGAWVVCEDAQEFLRGADLVFDLIFCDPPFGWDRWPELLAGCARRLSPDGWILAKHEARRRPEGVFAVERFRVLCAGEAAVSLYRKAER